MGQFAIVTDSAACISEELRQRYAIIVVPIIFSIGGEHYRDGASLSGEEFYRLLAASATPPATASTPPGDFLAALREAHQRSPDILCITIGSNFSGNYASACQAAEMAEKELPGAKVRVLDSRNAAMAQGFAVLAAAQGEDADDGLRRAESVVTRAYLIGVLDDLRYAARSGRVPRPAAWASSLLQIKPIFQYHAGEVTLLERTRTSARARQRLLDLAAQRIRTDEPLHTAVLHAHAPQEAQALAERVQERFAPAELLVTEFSQAMAIHSGPGLLGLAFYNG